jgi:hypothetical protein
MTSLSYRRGWVQYSAFQITRHNIVEGPAGSLELLEILDCPHGKAPIAIVYKDDLCGYLLEFKSLNAGKLSFKKILAGLQTPGLSEEDDFDLNNAGADRVLKFDSLGKKHKTLWFFALNKKHIKGDFSTVQSGQFYDKALDVPSEHDKKLALFAGLISRMGSESKK